MKPLNKTNIVLNPWIVEEKSNYSFEDIKDEFFTAGLKVDYEIIGELAVFFSHGHKKTAKNLFKKLWSEYKEELEN